MILHTIINRRKRNLLSFGKELSIKDKWRIGLAIFGGKVIGLILVLVGMKLIPAMIATPA